MHVLFATSESAGLAKTGGLADVSASLPAALRALGLDVRTIMPGYRTVLEHHPERRLIARLPGLGEIPPCTVEEIGAAGGTVYLVVAPTLFDRDGGPYADAEGGDWPDNDLRFARLGLAVAELAAGAGGFPWPVDLVHMNDWPASLAAGYLRWAGLATPAVLTVHNLAHQGVFDPARMGPLGIPAESFTMHGIEFHGRISFLKAGLFFSDHVATVSPTYAREITTAASGCGLHGLLAGLAEERRLTGILNGIDEDWVADAGAAVAANSRKADEVRTGFCLEPSEGPLFGFVARVDPQKGIDVLIEGARRVVQRGGQLAILGMGHPALERQLVDLAKLYRGAVGAMINYAEPLARRIMTAADFMLMPSRFEPCGLSQMYAQRLGSLPIAHATGGLADTIRDGRTGFLYRDYAAPHLVGAIDRAFAAYAERDRLEDMRRAARDADFSWTASAEAYADLYATAMARAAEIRGFRPVRRARSVPALQGRLVA
ncbi:glycogen synthase [Prosthecomicrobium sp. N25]|uniref:glycogen synthase n=1 Tax=Prosthecomicrobium sp. N25 TaxID=3129254 RepID=UPI0030777027